MKQINGETRIENIDFNSFNANLFWRFCSFINFLNVSSTGLSHIYRIWFAITESICLPFCVSIALLSLHIFLPPLLRTLSLALCLLLCLLLSGSSCLALVVLLLHSHFCSLAPGFSPGFSLLHSPALSHLPSRGSRSPSQGSNISTWGPEWPIWGPRWPSWDSKWPSRYPRWPS